MSRKTTTGILAVAMCAALLVVAGWDDAGEKAGETQAKLENAVHDAQKTIAEKVGDAGDTVRDKAEDVKKDAKDSARELKKGYERGYDKERQ